MSKNKKQTQHNIKNRYLTILGLALVMAGGFFLMHSIQVYSQSSWLPSGSGGYWDEGGTSVHDCGTLGTCGGDSGGGGGSYSSPAPTPRPTAPTPQAPTCLSNQTQVRLQWSASTLASSDNLIERMFAYLSGDKLFSTQTVLAGGGSPPPPPPPPVITYRYQINSQTPVSAGQNTSAGPINITPNTTYSYRVEACHNGQCTWSSRRNFSCNLPAPTVNLNASPNRVMYGQSSTISWSATNATSCTASGGWSGAKNASSGSQTISNLTSYTTFNLSCSGYGGTSQASTNVAVDNPAPVISLGASPSTIISGQSSTLNWSTQYATSCTASGGWSGNRSVSGSSGTGVLADSTNFILTCTGPGGTRQANATVNVQSGTGAIITVDRNVVRPNESVNITYDIGTSEPSTCSLKKGGIELLSPTNSSGTYTDNLERGEVEYSISCPGNEDSINVRVSPEFSET